MKKIIMIVQLHRESQKIGLKMNNYLQDHEIKTDDEVMECDKEYIYLRPKIGACTEKKKRRLEWSAIGRQHNVMKSYEKYFPIITEEKNYIINAFCLF